MVLLARPPLVIEVVQQRHDPPGGFVLTKFARVAADRSLDGERVLQQALAFRVLGQEFPRVLAVHFHRFDRPINMVTSLAAQHLIFRSARWPTRRQRCSTRSSSAVSDCTTPRWSSSAR